MTASVFSPDSVDSSVKSTPSSMQDCMRRTAVLSSSAMISPRLFFERCQCADKAAFPHANCPSDYCKFVHVITSILSIIHPNKGRCQETLRHHVLLFEEFFSVIPHLAGIAWFTTLSYVAPPKAAHLIK